MKVLQLTVHFSPNVGGVETHLNDLVLGLIKRNYEVFVLTYRPLTAKVPWKLYECRKNLKILRLPWFPGFFYRFVKNPLVEFLYLTPLLFLATPFVLSVCDPDVIHAHGLIAGFVGVFWGKTFGKRVLISTHSLYQFPKKGLYTSFVRAVFKRADKILTLSKQSKEEVVRLGVKREKVDIFTYWIDLNKFKRVPNAKYIVGWKDKFVVLFVGRLVVEKGVLILLDAAKNWDKKITLVIIGTGPLEAEIQNLKSEIQNLIYLGPINNEDLPKYYSASDLVIVPSIHEEGFGRVILESLACGTPVVGSNRGAIPEAMNETVGKLIDITPENIKDTVEYLYQNPSKLNKLSKCAREFAENKYSNKNLDLIVKTYE